MDRGRFPAQGTVIDLGGAGRESIQGVALDAAGNAYLTGMTTSTDFPVTFLAPQHAPGDVLSGDAFVTKLNPTGSGLVYSTYLGGSRDDVGNSIAIDAAGNAYVAGSTGSLDFPITPGAIQGKPGQGDVFRGAGDAFVTKINGAGTALVYSTYLGGTGRDAGQSLAVDASGAAFVTGTTWVADFPVTSGAFQSTGTREGAAGTVAPAAFVAKINPSGTSLAYSTYLGGTGVTTAAFGSGEQGSGIAVDRLGNAFVTGSTVSYDFPAYRALQPGHQPLCAQCTPGFAPPNAFITELNASGSGVVFSTYLGGGGNARGSDGDAGQAIALDSSGRVYVAGQTYSADFPVTPGAFQPVLKGTTCPSNAFVAKIDVAATPQFDLTRIVNSATYQGGPVAPGELVTIFGVGLGPVHAVGGRLTPQGILDNNIGATIVTFDGVKAPLLYVQANQINAIVPFSVAGRATTTVQVSFAGSASATVEVPIAGTSPGVFGDGSGKPRVFNEDWTVNSAAQPATRGSVVVMWATGGGVTDPALSDGAITPLAPPWPKLNVPVSATIGGVQAGVEYAGPAPGQVAGVLQINLRVPGSSPAGPGIPVAITLGGASTELSLAVK